MGANKSRASKPPHEEPGRFKYLGEDKHATDELCSQPEPVVPGVDKRLELWLEGIAVAALHNGTAVNTSLSQGRAAGLGELGKVLRLQLTGPNGEIYRIVGQRVR